MVDTRGRNISSKEISNINNILETTSVKKDVGKIKDNTDIIASKCESSLQMFTNGTITITPNSEYSEQNHQHFSNEEQRVGDGNNTEQMVSETLNFNSIEDETKHPLQFEHHINGLRQHTGKLSKEKLESSARRTHKLSETNNGKPGSTTRRLTQPAHLIACSVCVYLSYILYPESSRVGFEPSPFAKVFYLFSTSVLFGSQFWMTFVSGIALFFSVPRHTFASVQHVLFPLYFFMNSVLLLIAIASYSQLRPTHLWNVEQLIQGGCLLLGFIINLGIRLYWAPVLTKLSKMKIVIEAEAGRGSEIGFSTPGTLLNCPHYMRLYRAFRRVHLVISMGNIVSLSVTCFHMYYLATKLIPEGL